MKRVLVFIFLLLPLSVLSQPVQPVSPGTEVEPGITFQGCVPHDYSCDDINVSEICESEGDTLIEEDNAHECRYTLHSKKGCFCFRPWIELEDIH